LLEPNTLSSKLFLAGGTTMLLLWPYTLIVIMPINRKLMNDKGNESDQYGSLRFSNSKMKLLFQSQRRRVLLTQRICSKPGIRWHRIAVLKQCPPSNIRFYFQLHAVRTIASGIALGCFLYGWTRK
jgi:hypothetical protein